MLDLQDALNLGSGTTAQLSRTLQEALLAPEQSPLKPVLHASSRMKICPHDAEAGDSSYVSTSCLDWYQRRHSTLRRGNLALAMCAQLITTVLQNVSGRRFYPHVPLGFFLSHPSGQCWWWHLVSHKRHRRIRDSHFMFPGCLHLGEHHH